MEERLFKSRVKSLSPRMLKYRSVWLAAVVALCVACGAIAYRTVYAAYARSQVASAERNLSSVSATLNSLLGRHESLPRMLALDPRLSAAVADPLAPATLAATNAYLAEIVRRGDLLAAFLIDANGKTIAASNHDKPVSFVGHNYAFRPYFKEALANGSGRFYAVGATSREPGYFLASSVQAASGARGVVVVKVGLGSILSSDKVHGEGVAVVDEFGVAFLSSDPTLLYRPVQALRPADLLTLQKTQRYADQLGAPLVSDTGELRESDTPVLLDDKRRPVMPVWHVIEGRAWRVVSFQDLQPARVAGALGALASALAAALVVAAALALWSRRERAKEIERSRDRIRQSEERLRAVVDNLPVMVCFVSSAQRYVFANALYAQQYGKGSKEIEGVAVSDLLEAEEYEATQPYLQRALAGETVVFEREYRHTRHYKCFEATYRPEWNSDRTAVTGVHVMTQDVTQNRQRLHDLARLSQLDHLTQLMNRKGFEARLLEVLEGQRSDGPLAALLFIDLDGFKPINDTHGHAAGDAVLTAFGKRLSRLVREEDVVARLGGDEFAVLLPSIANAAVAERVAASVVALAERPFGVSGLMVSVGASVGVAYRHPGQSISAQDLCRSADDLLYAAKRKGRRTYVAGDASSFTQCADTPSHV